MCSLQQLLLLLSLFCLKNTQAKLAKEMCEAGGFNIAPLIKAEYYKIEIPKEFCSQLIFPDKCKIYVSFCKQLPAEMNLCHNDSLGPSSICITNGTIGYNLGEYTENPFEPILDTLVASFDNGSDVYCKNDRLRTYIEFQCGPYAQWDTLEGENFGDASTNFEGLIVDFLDLCSITITMNYDQLCPLAVCEAKDHNISSLLVPPHWKAVVDQRQCREFFGEERPCTLYFSFCENIKNFFLCANSTVCLTDGLTTYKFGQYNKYANPFAETEVGSDSLVAFYERGKAYPKCIRSTTTLFTLKCAPGQDWDGLNGNASAFLRTIEPSPEGPCLILISMVYSGACPSPPSDRSSSSSVSWGDLGLLLGLLVITDSAVNIASGKSTSPEMLHQFAFWKAFFTYIIEGVYFTANLLTCGWHSSSVGPASSSCDKL